jgi:hypothetical protein
MKTTLRHYCLKKTATITCFILVFCLLVIRVFIFSKSKVKKLVKNCSLQQHILLILLRPSFFYRLNPRKHFSIHSSKWQLLHFMQTIRNLKINEEQPQKDYSVQTKPPPYMSNCLKHPTFFSKQPNSSFFLIKSNSYYLDKRTNSQTSKLFSY